MFAILFYSNLYAFLGEGPYWFIRQNSTSCEKYWWTNLLYINNFYPTHLGDEVRYTLVVSLYRDRRRVKISLKQNMMDTKRLLPLRTVPTIVIAHTLCASQDTRDSYWWCLPIQ